ncbi:MAG: excinuclease ABC subunit A [Bacteroidetes bacterium CG23_combo_of_CG06-09_8_20_14_all_32_9]|nr:MAG: excinuclease ABC subunit A [Bacteroidetes bacterium CG23_combo_of_CG06-09_8_20_14_all_32_9]
MPEKKIFNKNFIEIKGAREHNLKNINTNIPRDKFVVITGLSGSGKSSLAFDTLYAEGQRRYVESLSSYARQFLGKISKPDVDNISGIPPAIAIEQRVNTHNPRSTVGTSTEIYEYIKLLFARIGITYSPISGNIVKKHSTADVINFISSQKQGTKAYLIIPSMQKKNITPDKYLSILLQQGYSRVLINNKVEKIENIIENKNLSFENFRLVIDRFEISYDNIFINRLADSVETAFFEGNGTCIIKFDENFKEQIFSNRFETDGIIFEEPNVHIFSFNSPVGACPTCDGFGQVIGIDEDLVIPNKSLSVYEDAVACWKGEVMSEWKNKLIYTASKFNFPVHKPYFELSYEQQRLLWEGNKYFYGIKAFFKFLQENLYKIQYRVMLARYRGKTLCPTCRGSRLKKEASYIKINGKAITEISLMTINQLSTFFQNLKLSENEQVIGNRLLTEIKSRLNYLENVGLGYLTLNRNSSSLSGGESQRINLSASLGSSLIGSLYILDEPSIGLHPVDNLRLISVLKNLRDIGNTVVVVEHDEEVIKSSDYIIDIGPGAGSLGGEIVFEGNYNELICCNKSLTADYITGKKIIEIPKLRKAWKNFIEINGARENNLKNINVKIPLNIFTVITGVSGSGKSTLVKKILYPALKKYYGYGYSEKTGSFNKLSGDLSQIKNVELVDQNPIGKSSRSNPVTYIKSYDEIRSLFSNQQLSKLNGFKPSHFSFNVDGGRCDECLGEGSIKVEMQFMADIHLVCESCGGKRFKPEILEVEYNKKNIFDILNLTVDDAVEFFNSKKGLTETRISEKLEVLQNVGLGYVKLGQSSSTLSGGESQRLKLATFLGKNSSAQTLFIFDEPTTGLHFHDIKKLLSSFEALIQQGNSVLVIEHNLDVIKCADWIIDLGPGGGESGGNIIFCGTPEELINNEHSFTGKYLKNKII